MFFDRQAASPLVDALRVDGPLGALIERRNAERTRFDVQLRRDQKGTRSWASFYAGLTTVLDIDYRATSGFRLRAHTTHRRNGDFDENWNRWCPLQALAAQWAAVESYLDRAIDRVPPRLVRSEGAVHGALCSATSDVYRVINREASPAFRDQATKDAILQPLAEAIYARVAKAAGPSPGAWWPGVRDRGEWPHLGTSLDLLAVDDEGRVLAIEAKPAPALRGIVWGPAQVRFYAELLARWLHDIDDATDVLAEMLQQRVTLGLTAAGRPRLVDPPVVVPVLAIGIGKVSRVADERLRKVAKALAGFPSPHGAVAPIEVWRVDDHGRPTEQQELSTP